MTKRMIATVLLITYIVSFSIMPVRATEGDYQVAEIVVDSFGKQYTEEILVGEDNALLAPVSWFIRYGLMACVEEGGRYVLCNTGEQVVDVFAKRIYIDKNGREAQCGYYVTETKFQTYMTHKFTQSIVTEKTLYLPLAEMLPLFNAKTEVTDDGILHINANAVSVFSAMYGLNLEELAFDADRDIVGHEFITASGMLVDTILDLRIDRLDGLYNTGEKNDYRELFKAFLVDDAVFLSAFDEEKSPTEVYIQEKRDILKDLDEILENAKIGPDAIGYILDSELYPGFHEFKDMYENMRDSAEGIYKFADYSNAYVNHVNDHVAMLEAVYKTEFFGEANPTYKAAKEIISYYGQDSAKQRKEIVFAALRDFIVDEFGDAAIVEFGLTPYKIAFNAVKMIKPEAVELMSDAAQLGYMDSVVDHASRIFEKYAKKVQYDAKTLDELRLTAMLALVASRHAYNTYWGEYAKVDEINETLTKLYLAAESVKYEAPDNYLNMVSELEKTEHILKLKVIGTADELNAKDIFDETYWYMSFGESLGYNYVAKFSADGTFVARGMGSGAYKNGTYTYANGKLVIVFDIDGYGYPSTIAYNGNKNGFTSFDKYPMQLGEAYYTISPDDGSAFYSDMGNSDPVVAPGLSDGEYYGRLVKWDNNSMTVELYEFLGWNEEYMFREFKQTGTGSTLDISRSVVWLEWPWGEDGNDIKCRSIDDALNTEIWGGGTTVRENCSMEISFAVENGLVSDIVFLYAS